MSAQIPESLIYDGKQYAMFTLLLEDYFNKNKMDSPFIAERTALYRGYIGTWEVRDDNKLYLIKLRGTLRDQSDATLESLFPDSPDGVFAEWCTGTARLPYGEKLKNVHSGFSSKYEFDLFLEFDNGVLTKSWLQDNKTLLDKISRYRFSKIFKFFTSR